MPEAGCADANQAGDTQPPRRSRTPYRGRRPLTWIIAGALLCSVLPLAATEAAVPDTKQYLWHSRVLLVFAPNGNDPALLRQRAILAGAGDAAGERDLVPVEVLGTDAQGADLRRRFNAHADHFRAVLVGKDGGAKLASAEPIPADRLFEAIDAMPMRRGEDAARKPGTR